jgi:hypothetical protein
MKMDSSRNPKEQIDMKAVKVEHILNVEIHNKVTIRGPLLGMVPNLNYINYNIQY